MNESQIVLVIGVLAGIIILAAIILLSVIKINSSSRKRAIENYGKPSEKRLKEILEKAFPKSAVFCGVYIPYLAGDRERYTEIDALVIVENGVFVIELKSHNGKIINGDTKNWTQIYNDKRISFYNPMYQNDSHVKVLNNIFKSEGQYNVPIHSVVTFSSNKVTFTNHYNNLIPLDDLVKYIKKTGKNKTVSMSQTTRLRVILRSYIRSGRRVEQKHKKYVRKRKRTR